jgi:serine phosphatase RsbU (regulator of sigma subunit)/transcriptional regulator with GAF, ATPase, and Fis domain
MKNADEGVEFELMAARADMALSEALHLDAVLARLGDALVPEMADWFSVDLLEDEAIRNMVVVHRDRSKVDLARELQQRFPSDPNAPSGVPNVVRTGNSELTEVITDEMLDGLVADAELRETLRSLGLRCAMVVPLRARGRVIGALTMVGAEHHERYSPSDLRVAEEIAARAALAIDTAQLFAREQEARAAALAHARRNEVLKEVTAAFGSSTTVEEVVQAMLLKGIRAAGARAATVGLIGGSHVDLVGLSGYEPKDEQYWHRFDLDDPLPMSDAIQQKRAVVITTTEERDRRYPALAGRGEHRDHTLVCVPMLLGGHPIGAFSASYPPGATFSDDDLSQLESMGEQCAQAVDRARSRAAAERATTRLNDVSAASMELAITLDLDRTIDTVLRLTTKHLGTPVGLSLPWAPGPVFAPGPSADPGVIRLLDDLKDSTPSSDLAVPLAADGRSLGIRLRIAGSPVGFLVVGRPTIDVTDPDDLQYVSEIGRRMSRAIENARLYTERDYVARTLQRSLLPPDIPTLPGLDTAALFMPAGVGELIGGDFYDVFEVAESRFVVVVGDVCGKGVEAATVTGIARRTLRALTHAQRPREMLEHLNRILLDEDLEERFSTAAILMLEPEDGGSARRAALALAGHPQALAISSEGAIRQIGRPGTLLGVTREVSIEDEAVSLEPGGSILLYTDGLIGKDEGAVPASLIAALEGQSSNSALDLSDRVRQFVEGNGMRHDDVAVVAIHFTDR